MYNLIYITLLLLLFIQCPGFSQTTSSIKIMTYNTSDADGSVWTATSPSRVSNMRNVISTVDPDILVAIEINNLNTDAFLTNVLNYDSPTYSKGSFIANVDGSPNSNCLYYKTSKFISNSFENTIIPSYYFDVDLNQLVRFRDINKFTITHNGEETIVIYAVHLSPSGGATNRAYRETEISYLLDYLSNHPSSMLQNFIVLGDFNTYRSDEGAYMNLLYYPDGGLDGYFYDPRQSDPPDYFANWTSSSFNGYWDTSLTYSSGSPGERFDMILMSANVWNEGGGIHYSSDYTVVGNPIQNSDAESASNHLPVYATFDFTNTGLPVELTYFTGVLNKKHVDLNWRTETEVNNFGFEIERTKDNSEWLTIGFVEGYGNSNSSKQYSFTDSEIYESGNYNYRLRQTDNDGTFEYSDVVTVTVGVPVLYSLGQNYPNPFNPETRIDYTIPKQQHILLRVYNILGVMVKELVNEVKPAGNYTITFDGSDLPSGVYVYRIQAEGFSENKKMTLLK